MYVFSANAKATQAFDEFAAGDEVPFIVYINYQDLYGAEQLCKIYLLQQGFAEPHIDKRKRIEDRYLNNPKVVDADPTLKEALTTGYSIQVFAAH